jgi:hypothetical protein
MKRAAAQQHAPAGSPSSRKPHTLGVSSDRNRVLHAAETRNHRYSDTGIRLQLSCFTESEIAGMRRARSQGKDSYSELPAPRFCRHEP